MKKLVHLLFETPIEDFKTVGDFSKPGQGWDKSSAKLLSNERGVEKIKQKWSKTSQNFNMYMIKKPGVKEFSEKGRVNPEFIEKELGLNPEEFKMGEDSDAITVFYVSNLGDQKVPMTAWIMAHRFAHAIQATVRNRTDATIADQMRSFENECKALLAKATEAYGVRGTGNSKMLTKAASLIGTFKSARDGNIRNEFEFIYEILAQYLITGEIKLNPLPASTDTYSRAVFGRKDSRPGRADEIEEFNESVEMFARDLQYYADDVLSACVGKTFVM